MKPTHPLTVGAYTPTFAFREIAEHTAVMRPDGALVALTGPTGSMQSLVDATLYAAAPDFLLACTPAQEFDPSPLDWLSALLAGVDAHWAWEQDEDPSATVHAVTECRTLLNNLRAAVKKAQPE